jgi:hypothetical protein
MKKQQDELFAKNVTSDEEFDQFVCDLLYVEPPSSLVENILSSVANLPLPQYMQPQQTLEVEDVGLIVQRDSLQPS